ncbi:IS3 family transposase [Amycolatopsis sp. A1MSW2902]|uniref:IS3 family transposase n=1 Tax=Amycolatopsis sp. A1MSW2902 TaxID=687413 RepID=UPI00307F13A1
MNVYPFIEAENAADGGNVKRACTLLKVSRAAYYAHRAAGPSARARQDAELTEVIAAIHDESNGTYGTPRLHAELRHRGHRHSRKRIARLLRAADRAGRAPKRWRTTTVPDPAAHTPAGEGCCCVWFVEVSGGVPAGRGGVGAVGVSSVGAGGS